MLFSGWDGDFEEKPVYHLDFNEYGFSDVLVRCNSSMLVSPPAGGWIQSTCRPWLKVKVQIPSLHKHHPLKSREFVFNFLKNWEFMYIYMYIYIYTYI